VDNPGRLITHDELPSGQVWQDAEVQQEVLKSHVLAIRKSLGDTAEEPKYILTLRKRGYKFIAPVRFDEASGKHPRARLGKFVDRARPLSELREALRLARSTVPQLVFVTGEPGIGKDRVGRAIYPGDRQRCGYIGHHRAVVSKGTAGIEPHYPVLEALGSLTRQRNGEAVVQALTETAPTWALQLPGLLSGQTRPYCSSRSQGRAVFAMVRGVLPTTRRARLPAHSGSRSGGSALVRSFHSGSAVGLRAPSSRARRADHSEPYRLGDAASGQSSRTQPQPRISWVQKSVPA